MEKNSFTDSHSFGPGAGKSSNFYPRYLAAKKSIDDRSLNQHVWQTLLQALKKKNDGLLQILEVGAGIGTMFARAVDWGLLSGPVCYMATDNDRAQLTAARSYLTGWAEDNNHSLTWSTKYRGRLITQDIDVEVVLENIDATKIGERADMFGRFHLVIAHAVLDLVDFSTVLPELLSPLQSDGLAYLTCNFDGKTVFIPELPDDKEILRLYHRSMENRTKGASRTGRNLLQFFQQQELEILAAGSSDWVLHPPKTGYSPKEEFFLHAIIDMVGGELNKTDFHIPGISKWTRLRHQQVDDGRLSFLASHLDFLIRR